MNHNHLDPGPRLFLCREPPAQVVHTSDAAAFMGSSLVEITGARAWRDGRGISRVK